MWKWSNLFIILFGRRNSLNIVPSTKTEEKSDEEGIKK